MSLAHMQPTPVDDAQLVAETLAGEAMSFQVLVQRYETRLFGLARHYAKSRAEVEDLVQETFLKAFRKLDTFQQQSSFYTWLYRIATNTILDTLKRRSRNPVQAVADPELLIGAGEGLESKTVRPDARLERDEIIEITREVLSELPEIFRTTLVLRELEGHSYQEIAEELGISIGTVESRLFRARARFKQRLAQRYPEFVEGNQ